MVGLCFPGKLTESALSRDPSHKMFFSFSIFQTHWFGHSLPKSIGSLVADFQSSFHLSQLSKLIVSGSASGLFGKPHANVCDKCEFSLLLGLDQKLELEVQT